MDAFLNEAGPIARHILQLGAGALVTAGIMNAAYLELVVGTVTGAATLAYYWFYVRPKTFTIP